MFRQSSFTSVQMPTPHARLAGYLDFIKQTEGQWFDGSLTSIEDRKRHLRQAIDMTRQFTASRELGSNHTLSAMEIERDLRDMYAAVDRAAQHFVSDETLDAQRELPHYSINAAPF